MTRSVIFALSVSILAILPRCNTQTNSNSVRSEGEWSDTSAGEAADMVASQAEATSSAASFIAARLIAAVGPLKDLQAYLEGTASLPSCPILIVEIVSTNTLDVALEYKDGCRPNLFSDSAIEVQVRGRFYTARYEYDLTYNERTANGMSSQAAVVGSLAKSTVDTTFHVSIDATSDSEEFHGSVTAVMDHNSNGIRLNGEGLKLTRPGQNEYSLSFENVAFSDIADSGHGPDGGTVRIEVLDEAESAEDRQFTFQY